MNSARFRHGTKVGFRGAVLAHAVGLSLVVRVAPVLAQPSTPPSGDSVAVPATAEAPAPAPESAPAPSATPAPEAPVAAASPAATTAPAVAPIPEAAAEEPAKEAESSARKPFGSKNQLTASVWRLYGASIDVQPVLVPDKGEHWDDVSRVTLSLLGTDAQAPYFKPRLGGDWFIIDHLSIGASGLLVFTSPEVGHTENLLIVHPRVGYGTQLNRFLSVWGTAGVTYSRHDYYKFETSNDSPVPQNAHYVDVGVAASVDAMLVVHPFGSFGFMVGPSADIGFAGSTRIVSGARSFGLMGGLVAWFGG